MRDAIGYEEGRRLAGALLYLFSVRLYDRAGQCILHGGPYGGIRYQDRAKAMEKAKEDQEWCLDQKKKAHVMLGLDPSESLPHVMDDPRVLRRICEILAGFDHVRSTMEE